MSRPHQVAVRADGIRLGQLLKLVGAIDQGSDVKTLLLSGAVTVNGSPESRRGAQLKPGDVVGVGTTSYVLTVDPT